MQKRIGLPCRNCVICTVSFNYQLIQIHDVAIVMKLETWTSVASLGLSIMFVTILLSFYNFLIGPNDKGPSQVVDPGTLLFQEVFISAIPCLVLAGFTFAMARSYGNRAGGLMLIASGIVMIAGMFVGTTMVPHIQRQYVVGGVDTVPYIFMAGGVGIIAVGGYLIFRTTKRFERSNLDDLR